MKQQISVFLLMARMSIYRGLVVLFAMAAVETGLFYAVLARGVTENGMSLEGVVEESRLALVFVVCFALLAARLFVAGYGEKTRRSYTLLRLSVSRRQVFLWQSIYNLFIFLLLWMTQILVAFALSALYVRLAPAEYVTHQTAFLAFYRCDFFHSILPLSEGIFWVRNILVFLASSLLCARYPRKKGQSDKAVVFMAAFMGALFVQELGNKASCLALIVFSLICIGVVLYRVFDKEDVYEA